MSPRQRMDAWAESGALTRPVDPVTMDKIIGINRLRMEGMGCLRIGRALELHPSTVENWLRRLGWRRLRPGRPRTKSQ